MDDKKLKSMLKQGYLQVRAIIEVVGKPEQYVTDTLKTHLKTIKENKDITIIEEVIEKPVSQENFFSSFAQIEMLVKDANELLSFCFDYMPSSIEIVEPEQLAFRNNDLSGFMNDMQARLHAVNTGVLRLKDLNEHYIRNTSVLLRNFLVVLLSSRPMTLKELSPYLGTKEEDTEKVLGILIKEGKVKKEGDKFIKNDRLQKAN